MQVKKTCRVKEIVPYERNEATMMIENFMVAANETVAEHFYWLGLPFVYRTHGVPEEEKMERLSDFGCTVYRTDQQGTITIRR